MFDFERIVKQAVQPTLDTLLRLERRLSRSCRSILAQIRTHLIEPYRAKIQALRATACALLGRDELAENLLQERFKVSNPMVTKRTPGYWQSISHLSSQAGAPEKGGLACSRENMASHCRFLGNGPPALVTATQSVSRANS